MFDKRNRWLTSTVLAIAGLAFSGFLVLPFVISVFDTVKAGNPTATPAATASSPQADLEAQAKGYELVLQREPDNQTALRGLVDIRIQQQNIQGIIAPLEKLVALNPDQLDYAVLLAQVKQRIGDREGAAQAYRNILASHPGDLNALQGLVALLLEQNRPQAAVGLLQDTLKAADEANKAQPGSVDVASVQLLLGSVYAEGGQFEEAIAMYDEAVQGDQNDFRPVLGKAMVLQRQGKNDEAQPLFASAVALAPDQYKDQITQIASGKLPSPTGAAGAAPGTASGAPPESAPGAPDAASTPDGQVPVPAEPPTASPDSGTN